MKKNTIAILLGIAMISCSKKEENLTAETNVMAEEPTVKSEEVVSNEPEGKSLIVGMDCMACHKEDSRLVGPSYQEIANKYTDADKEMLASRIIDGGSGNWGEVPMTPHAGLSKENAKKMVEYILSLKK